jgi:hypothetical protein
MAGRCITGQVTAGCLIGTVLFLGLLLAGCSVEKTQSAKAPDVDVDVDPGRWPTFNVKWADVDVGTKTKTITVPKLEWKREQAEIQVPYIDINPPGGGDREEQMISIELEAPSSGYDLDIREVRAAGDDLWVISELKQTGPPSGGPRRLSDQVIVNAPDDLDVRHVVIGQRPEGVYNQRYSFFPDMSALQQRLPQGGGRVLYQRSS